jgi:hypothetical protein
MSPLDDEDDYESRQRGAEFVDNVCEFCGDPLALDGTCENNCDFEDLNNAGDDW